MANFPQSFEPVNSDSILEQFLQLKGNVNRVNEAMVNVEQTADSAFEKSSNNEASIQVLENDVQTLSTGLETAEQNLSKCVRFDVQSLTDAQKAQARSNIGASASAESSTTVLVNGVAQTQIQFDSDPQTQIDSAKSEISALNSRVETTEDSITTNAGAISALDEKALKTPMTAPAENEIPTINTANAQVNVTVGNGLKIETNELKVDNNIIQDKLTAGIGISIENGVISSKITITVLWSGSKTDIGDITLSDDLNNYPLLILTGLNTSNEWCSFCVATSTIVESTDYNTPYDMGNNTQDANRYCNIYSYKNQRTLGIKSIGNMTLKLVEGVR